MRYVVGPMSLEDIDEVIEVEKEAFGTAWSASSYRREILDNRIARYIVIRELPGAGEYHPSEQPAVGDASPAQPPATGIRGLLENLRRSFFGTPALPRKLKPGQIIGFAGMWLMVDEAHLTTIGVRRAYLGRGLGELLLVKMLEIAGRLNATVMTLEVRVSNLVAQSLYKKYGFQVVGTRRRYYTDNNEDALIMTTDNINSPEFLARFAALKAANAQRTGVSNP